jgi:hypothetical protein
MNNAKTQRRKGEKAKRRKGEKANRNELICASLSYQPITEVGRVAPRAPHLNRAIELANCSTSRPARAERRALPMRLCAFAPLR